MTIRGVLARLVICIVGGACGSLLYQGVAQAAPTAGAARLTAPVVTAQRGICRRVDARAGMFVALRLPAGTSADAIFVTRRGRNLDPDNDGYGYAGQWIVVASAAEYVHKTWLYIAAFRFDLRPGRLCFTVKWRAPLKATVALPIR